MKLNRIVASIGAVVLAATGLVACSNDSSSEAGGETIRIGTTDANLREWDVFQDLAEKEGFNVEIVAFSDYNTPNDALAQGEIDLNKFQHLLFLSEYNSGSNNNLVPISSTEIYPLALFWKDHKSLDGIEGQEVAIPNDPTNQGRAINVLVQADLVKLKTEGLLNPTPADVDTAASKVTLTPVDAAQTTVAYNQGTPAVINNSFLERAGIDPANAIFHDDPSSELAEPYINAWVATAENADNPDYLRLAELWHDPAVTEAVLQTSGGTAVAVNRPKEELVDIVKRLEDEK